MSKSLLSALFGAMIAFSGAAFAADTTVADFHTEMGGCENCHEDGSSPSANGEFEQAQCESCHGGLAEMNEKHKAHDGMMNCADCHTVHDHAQGQKPTCDACHDDGRQ